MWRTLILGLGAGAMAWAQTGLSREGQFWVSTLTGAGSIAPASRLRISSRGDVTVKGAAREEVAYKLRIAIKTASQAEARRILDRYRVRLTRQGDQGVFTISNGSGNAALTVQVPRALEELLIQTTEGALDISSLDGAVRASTGGGRVHADQIRGAFAVNTAGGDIHLGTIGGSVHCITAGGRIVADHVGGTGTFETGGGDIQVREVGGEVRASTGGGGIRIVRAGAMVTAYTGGGPIDVGQARGAVIARNSGGPVEVGSASGVNCENAAGGVRLENVSGALRVSTAFGSIIASLLSGRPLRESYLSTENGDITVLIPSNLGVTIRAQNDSSEGARRIVSEFPGLPVRVQNGRVVAEGPINGGGPLLRISGTGGTIFIKRQ